MRVLFVCSGGMSSSIVVNALKKEAEKKGMNMDVLAIGTSEVEEEVKKGWDVVMVAPQIRHRFESVKKAADQESIPCGTIPPQAYTPLGGPTLLKAVKELIG
ncbi:PTS sugar transporter subunit IIB [Bacillus sp. DX1.1]|uniref:PTS sugar transporter subunit IIB n=1 Tax=unclassified Bacillus (in: firmicutes) TaxID=185979 RepID=UPI0025702DFD|nr:MULTISPECIES: PTS sugar transporter subunit IIB [unclassified Bacillus (in: firmicutes)]MDM5154955.1 PTS sugar transporter subunit IIB [Bacillus sp. DX1.1]WJE83819.1 PTS sugar transporter subunit IIB [Bacillus sp. DX3.1]